MDSNSFVPKSSANRRGRRPGSIGTVCVLPLRRGGLCFAPLLFAVGLYPVCYLACVGLEWVRVGGIGMMGGGGIGLMLPSVAYYLETLPLPPPS